MKRRRGRKGGGAVVSICLAHPTSFLPSSLGRLAAPAHMHALTQNRRKEGGMSFGAEKKERKEDEKEGKEEGEQARLK